MRRKTKRDEKKLKRAIKRWLKNATLTVVGIGMLGQTVSAMSPKNINVNDYNRQEIRILHQESEAIKEFKKLEAYYKGFQNDPEFQKDEKKKKKMQQVLLNETKKVFQLIWKEIVMLIKDGNFYSAFQRLGQVEKGAKELKIKSMVQITQDMRLDLVKESIDHIRWLIEEGRVWDAPGYLNYLKMEVAKLETGKSEMKKELEKVNEEIEMAQEEQREEQKAEMQEKINHTYIKQSQLPSENKYEVKVIDGKRYVMATRSAKNMSMAKSRCEALAQSVANSKGLSLTGNPEFRPQHNGNQYTLTLIQEAR